MLLLWPPSLDGDASIYQVIRMIKGYFSHLVPSPFSGKFNTLQNTHAPSITIATKKKKLSSIGQVGDWELEWVFAICFFNEFHVFFFIDSRFGLDSFSACDEGRSWADGSDRTRFSLPIEKRIHLFSIFKSLRIFFPFRKSISTFCSVGKACKICVYAAGWMSSRIEVSEKYWNIPNIPYITFCARRITANVPSQNCEDWTRQIKRFLMRDLSLRSANEYCREIENFNKFWTRFEFDANFQSSC